MRKNENLNYLLTKHEMLYRPRTLNSLTSNLRGYYIALYGKILKKLDRFSSEKILPKDNYLEQIKQKLERQYGIDLSKLSESIWGLHKSFEAGLISHSLGTRRDIDMLYRDNQNPQGGSEYPSRPYEMRKVSGVPAPMVIDRGETRMLPWCSSIWTLSACALHADR